MVTAGLYMGANLDGGMVQDARRIWVGRNPHVAVREIAVRVAPILWFSPDEPHVLEGNPTPAALPCDLKGDGATVYYRRVDAERGSDWLTIDQPILELE